MKTKKVEIPWMLWENSTTGYLRLVIIKGSKQQQQQHKQVNRSTAHTTTTTYGRLIDQPINRSMTAPEQEFIGKSGARAYYSYGYSKLRE